MKIKITNRLLPAAACLLLAACAEDYKETIPTPEKPADVKLSERLASYDVLGSYASAAGIKMGVAVDPDVFASGQLLYSVVKSNFSQVESSVGITPFACINSENVYDFGTLSTLVDAAAKGGIDVFGPAFCSDVNIPDDYLNSLIAKVVIPYEPWAEDILEYDFESDPVGTAYPSVKKSAGSSNVAVMEDPLGQNGKVLGGNKLTMDLPLLEIKLPAGFTLADVSRVKLKCQVLEGTPTTSRIQVDSCGFNEKGNPYSSKNQWEEYVFDLTKIKFKDEELARNTIKVAVGAYGAGVSCCIDDVTIRLEHSRGDDTVIEKTPEEKTAIIKDELYKWVDGVLTVCGETVKEYVIFDEPLDSETVSFHWSDYLGAGYVADVQKTVAEKAGSDVRYYVSQTMSLGEMMAEDVAALKGKIQALEQAGVKVDAVNIRLNATYSLDYTSQLAADAVAKEAIKSLATLGKPVRVSAFKVTVADASGVQANPVNLTDSQRQAVGEFYELVISELLASLGQNADALSLSSALDTTQEVSPWKQSGDRSFVYEGIVRGLTK